MALNFSWKWYLKDLQLPNKPVKVFSTFSCGGGSTMGYKRAGFEVLGNVELDNPINAMYVKNHHPVCITHRKYSGLYHRDNRK